MIKPLIIYGFYGLGKTTLTNTDPDVYYDDDWAVLNKKPYQNQPIILTNKDWLEHYDYIFLPKDIDNHIAKLPEDKKQFFKEYGDDYLITIYQKMSEKSAHYCCYLSEITELIKNSLPNTKNRKED